MKKILITFAIISILLPISVGAITTEEYYYCPKEPYNISKGFAGFFSSVTGTNFLVTKIAEKEIEKALKKDLGAKFNVKINTFGGNNLQNGKFKKLVAKANNIESNGFFMSTIEAETVCGFNHVKYENNQLYFVENMLIKYQGKITESDLQKTINSKEYTDKLNKLSINSNGKTIAKIMNNNIKIVNNKIVMSYDIMIPMFLGTIPKHIEFSTSLDVENGKIRFDDIDFGNPITNAAMKSTLPMINLLNPLVSQVKTDKKNNAIINVKNVKIINNEILTDGIIIIPKNYDKK